MRFSLVHTVTVSILSVCNPTRLEDQEGIHIHTRKPLFALLLIEINILTNYYYSLHYFKKKKNRSCWRIQNFPESPLFWKRCRGRHNNQGEISFRYLACKYTFCSPLPFPSFPPPSPFSPRLRRNKLSLNITNEGRTSSLINLFFRSSITTFFFFLVEIGIRVHLKFSSYTPAHLISWPVNFFSSPSSSSSSCFMSIYNMEPIWVYDRPSSLCFI